MKRKSNDNVRNELQHLKRSELIDLLYEMEKGKEPQIPALEEVEKEQKRLNHQAAYRRTLRGTIAVLIVVAAISVLVATLWMPVLQIYGSSMSPTLQDGQIVISVKDKQLKTGEIVAFWQGNKLLVKRVIAGPGQWIDMDADGTVTVDGEVLDEEYLQEASPGICDIELPHQVAESHWFLMGDNREVSVDSRSSSIGDISEDQLEGKIVFRIWPLNQLGPV